MTEDVRDNAPDKESLRKEISELDEALIGLLGKRVALAEAMARVKRAAGEPVRDRVREEAVLKRVADEAAALGLPEDMVERLFQDIFQLSVERQSKAFDGVGRAEINEAKVAYLGGPGSYSHLAAQAFFSHRGRSVLPCPRRDYNAIFRAVQSGEADYGLAPIENTTTGAVSEVYDLLIGGGVKIVGERHLKVEHCLVGRTAGRGRITRLYGHPEAFAQCRGFLLAHPEISTHYVSSTTRALERVLDDGPEAAAIAGAEAARLFGMDVLERGLGDHEACITRFIVIGREAAQPTRAVACKTSLVFVTRDKPGALIDALVGFREQEINLSKLESRPIPGNPFEEMFILDAAGHLDEPGLKRALEALQSHTRELRTLGCYAADRIDAVSLHSEP